MTYERQAFNDHLAGLRWKQGQHVFIAGPTESGKTTLAKSLLDKRSHVVAFGVKPRDKTLSKDFADWSFVESWGDIEPWMNKIVIWPKPKRKEDAVDWADRQTRVFKEAFNKLTKATNWGVFIDELAYMVNPKFGGVGKQIEMLHYIGRSSGMSILSLAQRPAHVPLAVISNSSHAYVARTYLAEDVKRLSNLGGVNAKELANELAALPTRHDFIYQPSLAGGSPAIINTRQ